MRLDNFDYTRLRQMFTARRNYRGLRQSDVAERAGLNQSQICDLETGRVRDPRLSTVIRWADGVGCYIELDLQPKDSLGTNLLTLPRHVAAYLVAGHLAEVWQAWKNDKDFPGSCPNCCGPCSALKDLMDLGWLDMLYAEFVKLTGPDALWDEERAEVERGWLTQAWSVHCDTCHGKDTE